MHLTDVKMAIEEAKRIQRTMEDQSYTLANLLRGNLRNVTKSGGWIEHKMLAELKAELSQYNAKTRKWKN